MNEPKRNEWFSPSNLLTAVGMLGAVFTAYVTLDSRITRVEAKTESGDERLARMENKIDRLIEQRMAAR